MNWKVSRSPLCSLSILPKILMTVDPVQKRLWDRSASWHVQWYQHKRQQLSSMGQKHIALCVHMHILIYTSTHIYIHIWMCIIKYICYCNVFMLTFFSLAKRGHMTTNKACYTYKSVCVSWDIRTLVYDIISLSLVNPYGEFLVKICILQGHLNVSKPKN